MVAAEASQTTAMRANPGRSLPFLSVYNDTAHRTVALFSLPRPRVVPFGPEKGLVHFHQSSQAVSRVSIPHRFANLMGHQPRCRAIVKSGVWL